MGLTKIHDNISRWLPYFSTKDKQIMMQVLTGPDRTFGMPLIEKYLDFLMPYLDVLGLINGNPRENDCAVSGLIFFYGCLIYIMHFQKWGDHVEDIFHYNLLYLLVDHYIDDIKLDSSVKNIAIEQMFILINDPLQYNSIPLIDPILKTIAITYHKLITRCPAAKPQIIKLFMAEIDGLAVQRNPSLDRSQYYNMALNKGGYTLQVIPYILGITDVETITAAYHIGTIMQLIDDSIDVFADRNCNINTIATFDLKTKGNLDELWMDIVDRIMLIDQQVVIFKIL
jgi:hypothetical protein